MTLTRKSHPLPTGRIAGVAGAKSAAFKPEIQALRALAVALVVLYHLWPNRLSGGYVGVDVFFVISGFLISRHLISEVDRTGTISLRSFYARRIRRLLPAAFLVLLFSVFAAAVWIPDSLRVQSSREIGASALYFQNWLLAQSSVDYLTSAGPHSLVQHYWSLSVEEQFYLVWPLLLVAIAFATRGRSSEYRKKAILLCLVAVFVVSFAYSVWETARSQQSAYFITPTRAWEFAAGGLASLIVSEQPRRTLPDRARPFTSAAMRSVAGWLGIFLILIAAVSFTAGTAFPGYLAGVPVIGAVLVMLGGSPDSRWSITGLARFRAIQFVGGISYSLYLWHWTLIVLFPFIFERELGFRTKIAVVGVAVALAILTKKLVEDRGQTTRFIGPAPAKGFAFAAIGMVVIVGCCAVQLEAAAAQASQNQSLLNRATAAQAACLGAASMVSANSCGNPFAVTKTVLMSLAQDSQADSDRCQEPLPGVELRTCVWGDTTNPTKTIALIGDSHAMQLMWPLDDAGKKYGWKIETFVKSNCPLITRETYLVSAECVAWTQKVLKKIKSDQNIEDVLYSDSTDHYIPENATGDRVQTDDISTSLRALKESDKQVVAVRDVPGSGNSVAAAQCVATSNAQSDPCPTSRELVLSNTMLIDAARDAAVPLIDLSAYFCDSTNCHSVIGGLTVYHDGFGHMTEIFARTLAPYLGRELNAAFTPKNHR